MLFKIHLNLQSSLNFIQFASFYFSMKGFADIVQCLIDNHADVDTLDGNGHSPLYTALKEGQQVYLINSNDGIEFKLLIC